MDKSKKVGLVAVSNNNYGSQLQTFAMHHALKLLGVDNEVIRYKQTKVQQFRRLFNASFLVIKGKAIVRDIISKIKYPVVSKGINQRNIAFDRFKSKYIEYSPFLCSRVALIEQTKSYKGVILGSDQVWHPANLEMDYFTLTFVPDEIPKITFAPSFGVSEIPDEQIQATKQYLSRIDSISVREKKGAEIVKSLIGRDVEVVCDPTALLTRSEWDKIKAGNEYSSEPYIFCYYLGNNISHREFANKVKKATGYKIITLQHMDEFVKSDLLFGDIVLYDIGPDDFVSLIANAEIVLTDSFHGTMFSIYYHKNFLTFQRYNSKKKASTNSRIDNILSTLELMDRRVDDILEIDKVRQKVNDWSLIDERLDALRQKSIDYLKRNIEKYSLM